MVGMHRQHDTRAGSRIERSEIVEAEVEAVIQWLHQEMDTLLAKGIVVHAGELAELELDLFVGHQVGKPVRVEHFCPLADQARRIGYAAEVVGSKIGAALP